jgi:hypothetical protein
MSTLGPPDDDAPPGDETRAFQRFYLAGSTDSPPPAAHGLLYRLLVGWWRDRP